MNQAVFAMTMLLSRYFEPRFNTELQMLIFQIGMLRDRIDQLKVVPTTQERAELLRLGKSLGHNIFGLMIVVKPKTYKKMGE